MLKDRLDKYFKEKLESNPQWDKEALWDSIEHEMDKPKRNRRVIFFWIIGLLLSLVAFYSINKALNKEQTPRVNTFAQETKTDLHNEEESTIKLDENADDASLKSQMIDNSVSESDLKVNTSDELISSSNSRIQKTSSELENESISKDQEPAETNIATVLKEDPALPVENNTSLDISLIQLSTIETIGFLSLLNNHNLKPESAPYTMSQKLEVLNDQYSWHQLELFAGVGIADRQMVASQISEESLVETRTQNEKLLEKRTAGLLFRKGLKKNWHLSTGIFYAEQHEQMNTSFTLQSTESRKKMDAYVFTGTNGVTSFIEGEVDVSLSQDFDIQHYNVLRSVEVPLLIGYHYQNSKVGFIAELGPSLVLNQKFEGRLFNNSNEELVADDIYKNSMVTRIQIRTGLQFAVTRSLNLSAGLNYSRQLNSSLNEEQNYSLKYFDLGLNLGAVIQF